ncbi:hypothetical protein MKY42_32445 [Paenibacillus sp. FSL W7-1088]
MKFNIELEYTPRSPVDGIPYTEASFVRRKTPFTFDVTEIGVALIDVWNFGWENSPVVDSLGYELSLERGVSHARRKREITINAIKPTVDELRKIGVQIFHCNHKPFLEIYPQWHSSTIPDERITSNQYSTSSTSHKGNYPSIEWVDSWKGKHIDDVFNSKWMEIQGDAYEQISIPKTMEPQEGDILVYSHQQFHRLLQKKQIRVLFYMGFETDECVQHSDYGIVNMNSYGYMTNIVRDCTTTYESAETLNGLWRTKVAIESIEKKWGYSICSFDLVDALKKGE